MNSANYVSAYIAEMKANGTPLQEIAWKAALACKGWAYVYGARGEYCDPSNRRSRQNPDHPTIKSACKNFSGKDSIPAGCVGCQWFTGKADADESRHEGRTRFFDCRGFTYWILLQVYGWKLMGSGATTQWVTASNWQSKGKIADMPKDTLCCLFVAKGNKMEHTGFGFNGETVECSSGVQHFKTRKKKWTHFAVPACVTGGTTPQDDGDDLPTLRKGDRGEYVALAQIKLIQKGFSCGSCGADGIFGDDTLYAVEGFQMASGIAVDGVIGAKTWELLASTEQPPIYTVTIPNLHEYEADALLEKYPGSFKTVVGG